jgi:xanthine dehydrogenase YagT iron-sulfur-binding subunit
VNFLEKIAQGWSVFGVAAPGFSSQRPAAGGRTMQTTDIPSETTIKLTVNGAPEVIAVDVRTSLLDLLRERLHLSGTKKGCDHGQCGACTVHVNGRRVTSCLTLAVMHDGAEITTIEGLGSPEKLHPMQAAFVACDAYQCGYCTSGQIMSAVALLKEPCGPDDAAVKELMSGNICRCGAYANIVAAIQQVRKNT